MLRRAVAARVLGLWAEANRLVGTAADPAPLGAAPRLEGSVARTNFELLLSSGSFITLRE